MRRTRFLCPLIFRFQIGFPYAAVNHIPWKTLLRIPDIICSIHPQLLVVIKKLMMSSVYHFSGSLGGKFPFGRILKRIARPSGVNLGQ